MNSGKTRLSPQFGHCGRQEQIKTRFGDLMRECNVLEMRIQVQPLIDRSDPRTLQFGTWGEMQGCLWMPLVVPFLVLEL